MRSFLGKRSGQAKANQQKWCKLRQKALPKKPAQTLPTRITNTSPFLGQVGGHAGVILGPNHKSKRESSGGI